MSVVVHLYSSTTKNQKKVSGDQEIPQSQTRPDIIIHFIKQRDQFHFERKLYVQKCMSVSVSLSPMLSYSTSTFVACCVETPHYKRFHPPYW